MKNRVTLMPLDALCAAALVLLSSVGNAVNANPSATFSNFTYSGTGCPGGTATAAILNTSGNLFEVDFTQFKIPFNSPPAMHTKECMLSAIITPPAGYKVSVHPAIYSGNIGLNTTGVLTAGHQFGASSTPVFNEPYKGLINYSKTHSAVTAFSKCATPEILKDSIKLVVNQGDPANGDLKKIKYLLQFQPCVAVKVDAISEAVNQPTNTPSTTNVASNDIAPAGSTYTLTGGTCTNAAISAAGIASYLSPNTTSGASCTVIYKVCAPAPNASVCDTATLTVKGPSCGPTGGGSNC
jgi:Domain of unknown function (DUF4360)